MAAVVITALVAGGGVGAVAWQQHQQLAQTRTQLAETQAQLQTATSSLNAARTQLAAYFYHYEISDLVERYSTQTDFFFFRNRGRARLRGVELAARSDLGAGFGFQAGVNIGRGKALDDGAHLDDIAPDSLFLVGRKDFGNRAFAQLRASFMAEDDRPGPSEVGCVGIDDDCVVVPAAQVVDLSAGWRFSRNLELRGIVRNLLDEAYFASPDPRWVYAPGRSGSVTLAFQF